MHAVVLVGGFGTRLRPLTDREPKPMLPIVGRPMIVRLVEHYAAGGVTDVVLALGFQPEPFYAAFPDGEHAGVRVHYAVEPEPLDTGGAIAFAARQAGVDRTFVVGNGDVITDLSIRDLAAAHRASGRLATLHLTPVPDPSSFGVAELDADLAITRFVEKPAPGETPSNLINAGTYVFEPEVLDLVEPDRRVSVEREVFPELVARGRLGGFPTDDYWIDIGRPEPFLQANLDAIAGLRGVPEGPYVGEAFVDPAALVRNSVVDGARVEAGAQLIDSVVLPGGQVGPEAVVERSIVAGRVGAGASISDAVVGEDEFIEASTQGERTA